MIDTHLHVWSPSRLRYDWLTESAGLLFRDFEITEVLPELEAANIKAGVLVQAANSIEETNFLLQVAEANLMIQGVIGWIPLLHPEQAADNLATLCKNPFFKGIRHLIHEEPHPDWLAQEPVLASLRELARQGYPYEVVGSFTRHLPVALRVAEKIPTLKLVINHLGNPPLPGSPTFKEWRKLISQAAENPNIYAKISGLGTGMADRNQWQVKDLESIIPFVLENFGTHRVFCGSDWPVCSLAGGYQKSWRAYQDFLNKHLPSPEVQQVLERNAVLFYKLPDGRK